MCTLYSTEFTLKWPHEVLPSKNWVTLHGPTAFATVSAKMCTPSILLLSTGRTLIVPRKNCRLSALKRDASDAFGEVPGDALGDGLSDSPSDAPVMIWHNANFHPPDPRW